MAGGDHAPPKHGKLNSKNVYMNFCHANNSLCVCNMCELTPLYCIVFFIKLTRVYTYK